VELALWKRERNAVFENAFKGRGRLHITCILLEAITEALTKDGKKDVLDQITA
jgi:hypothetical protein